MIFQSFMSSLRCIRLEYCDNVISDHFWLTPSKEVILVDLGELQDNICATCKRIYIIPRQFKLSQLATPATTER